MTGPQTETQTDYDRIAEIYDLYVTADYDLPFFLQEAAEVRGPILELTAGTGRLSIPLLEAGSQLTCVDGSQGMLDVLSRKLEERALKAEVRCADVCDLELPTVYEVAILRERFEGMARDEGFQVAALYGSYDRSAFEPDRSPVMIWVLEKRG